jgi:hypothetical protein
MKILIIHHNREYLNYLSAFYIFAYVSESFCLHVIFE